MKSDPVLLNNLNIQDEILLIARNLTNSKELKRQADWRNAQFQKVEIIIQVASLHTLS